MRQKVLLMVAFMVMCLGSAIAGNSDYYFKTTVAASGAGKVYASMEAEATPEFQESITLEPEKENARNAPSKTFYLWAEPEEGMEAIWSTTSANVTLTPSEDGLTATAIVKGNTDANTENIIIATFARPVAKTPLIGSTSNLTTFWPTLKVGLEAENGATIHYTTDGSEPTASSAIYTDSILLNRATTTVQAIAIVEGKVNSAVASATFTAVKPEGSLELESKSLNVLLNTSRTIAITAQSHSGAITWSSDNEEVVSIDANTGVLTTLSEGVATITAELAEDIDHLGASASCTLTVKQSFDTYQVQNSDFELWDDEDNDKIEPTHWNSFMHASGSLSGMVSGQQVKKSEDARPGSEGQYSAKIYAREVKVLGITVATAQGNLTTGRINAGSMSASDAKGNYNYTSTDDDNFRQIFTGLPDSVRVWVKPLCEFGGAISCFLHTNGYFQSPMANEITASVVASAEKSDIATSEDWLELSLPLTYNEEVEGQRPAYALITFTTSGTAGKSNKDDWMLIDDLCFIYNSELEKATYGNEVILFDEDGKAAVDEYYDADMLSLKANGRAATIETAYDENTAVLTVTVFGDDYRMNAANTHTYAIQFRLYDGIRSIATGKDAQAIYDLAGRRVQNPTKGGIYIIGDKKVLMK